MPSIKFVDAGLGDDLLQFYINFCLKLWGLVQMMEKSICSELAEKVCRIANQ